MVSRRVVVILLIVLQEYCVLSGRSKRSTCHAKFNAIPNHSACLPASSNLQRSVLSSAACARCSGVSDDDRDTIVDEHNKYRSQVSPSASGMMKMSWDEEVELVAQKYADACKVGIHDANRQRSIPGRFSVGQNLAAASSDIGWTQVVKLWHDEVSDFKTNGGNILSEVGHYTQVVWADSIKLGCGYALCSGTHNYVCNYAPGGNFDIDTPYSRGSSCADCAGHCSNNLCDCDGLACQNGASMDKSACTCSCKTPPLYFGQRCDLNCSQSDPLVCLQFQVSQCDIFANVPQDCPTKCNVCPYADATTEPSGSGCRVLSSWFLYSLIALFALIYHCP